jgi:3-oxoacyl-[acyl-carrier-protein] synthase-3
VDLADKETGEMPADAPLSPTLRQDGQTVFRWASFEMTTDSGSFSTLAIWSMIRMLAWCGMKAPRSSGPILLKEHPELSGKPALQVGFGAGLVFAAQVVILP